MLYNKINNANTTLSKSDKDARKREIKKIQGALSSPQKSNWDLSDNILKAINKT